MPVIDIDRDAAQQAAERELAKPIYPRPSLTQRLLDLLDTLLRELAARGAQLPGGWFTISLLLLACGIAAVAAVGVARRTLRTRRADHRVFDRAELTAAEHRAAAERAAAAGDWSEAIRHRVRAVARELEQTDVLHPAPGCTANELARDAGIALPALATEFVRAAAVFNDVSYGELPAAQSDYRGVADLDNRLSARTESARPR